MPKSRSNKQVSQKIRKIHREEMKKPKKDRRSHKAIVGKAMGMTRGGK